MSFQERFQSGWVSYFIKSISVVTSWIFCSMGYYTGSICADQHAYTQADLHKYRPHWQYWLFLELGVTHKTSGSWHQPLTNPLLRFSFILFQSTRKIETYTFVSQSMLFIYTYLQFMRNKIHVTYVYIFRWKRPWTHLFLRSSPYGHRRDLHMLHRQLDSATGPLLWFSTVIISSCYSLDLPSTHRAHLRRCKSPQCITTK